MLIYIARRLLIAIFTLWVVTMMVYGLIRSVPGDPFTPDTESAQKSINLEDIKRAKEALGLNDNIPVGYFKWFKNILSLDFGQTIKKNQPVGDIIGRSILPTLYLTLPSFLLAYLLAIPIGLYNTAKANTFRERTISVGLYMLYSLPAFVAAVFVQSLFSIKLQGTWLELPLFGMTSDNYSSLSFVGKIWDVCKHLFLPVFCYTYGILAYDSRFIQANMAEVVRQDYIRTARAKGVSERTIYTKHAFRNTLIPFVTQIGLTMPALLGGSVVLEYIFSWPGMGTQLISAINELEYFLIMAIVLLYASMALIGQLVADLLYVVVDPRITYD